MNGLLYICVPGTELAVTLFLIIHPQTYLSAKGGTSIVIIICSCEIQNIVVEGAVLLLLQFYISVGPEVRRKNGRSQ